MAPRDMTGSGYGQVVLPITIENYVVDDSMLTTDTMTAIRRCDHALRQPDSDTAPLELHWHRAGVRGIDPPGVDDGGCPGRQHHGLR